MATSKSNVVSTDVFIAGGGLSGLVAAIKIKEENNGLDVVVADKGGIGWAGQTPTGGGHLITPAPGDDLNPWMKWVVQKGEYLTNQEWLYNFGSSMYDSLSELNTWGVPFLRNPEGKVDVEAPPGWSDKRAVWVTHRVLLHLKKIALAKGVKLLNKIEVVDLIKADNQIAGAVGFSILTGEFYVFKSRATILANGPGSRKNRKLFSMCCGEGIAAAYRAGSEHLHSEFGIGGTPQFKDYEVWWRGTPQKGMINNKGEYFFEKYYPGGMENIANMTLAMYKEVEAGRGPIYVDLTRSPEQFDADGLGGCRQYKWTFTQGIFLDPERILRDKGGIDLRRQKAEWVPNPTWRLGNIKVDLNCKSPLQGLWAVGDTIGSGAALEGAFSFNTYPGWGLSLAVVTGLKAAKNVAKLAPEFPKPKVKKEEQDRLKERLFAPLKRKSGPEPYTAITKIQEAVIPIKVYFIREGSRLKKALGTIEEVKKELLTKIKAADPHELLRYHEAESMAICSEMTLRAALLRTESRGAHIREDYPDKDNSNWLKWTVIKKDGEKMALSTIPIPIQTYKFKP